MEIPFVGGAYEGRSKDINAQRSINLFPVVDNEDAKSVVAMYGTPGNTVFCTSGTTAIVRGMHVMGNYLYSVVGNTVYQIVANGTPTSLGVITTSTGHVGMADNGTQLLIVDGTAFGHIVTTDTLTDISDGDFPTATDCAFFDGYFIVTVGSTGRINISGLYEGTTWDALEYTTAEAVSDDLVGIGTTSQNLWLLGERSVEVYYNSGNTTFPFARVPGAITPIGCGAVDSIVEINEKIYCLSNKKSIMRSTGYSFEIISTPTINYQISSYATISDALAFTYTLEGREFYVIHFPTPDKTWALDVESLYWHEWQSLTGSVAGAFRGVTGVVFNSAQLVGDSASGKIYTLSMNTYTDNALNIRRIRRTQTINKEKFNVIHHQVELDFESGVGLDVASTADGYDPQVTLKWSDDGGNTWSDGEAVSLGKYQKYSTRQRWRRLGKSRNRVYEATIETPVKVVLLGSFAELEECGH
jgi:hypothetical protein